MSQTSYYVVLKKDRYHEPIGPENGYGDFPNYDYTLLGPLEAKSYRSAQYAFRKIFPNLRFSDRFSPWLYPVQAHGDLDITDRLPVDPAWTDHLNEESN